MGSGLTRISLQKIAERKFEDAKILAGVGSFSNAYYLSGYAIEIGIKACIARRMAPETIPDKAMIQQFYVHPYQQLINISGLQIELSNKIKGDASFAGYWAIATKWTPDSRYESVDSLKSQLMISAVNEVLPWIKNYW